MPKKYSGILVSACLAGINCYYRGGNKLIPKIKKLVDAKGAFAVCPEVMGGLKTPRERSEIANGTGKDVLAGKARVVTETGKDVTSNFIRGAKRVLNLARKNNVKRAIFKARSPSCGWGYIGNGTFTGKLIKGNGVTAELLHQNGLKIITDEEFLKSHLR